MAKELFVVGLTCDHCSSSGRDSNENKNEQKLLFLCMMLAMCIQNILNHSIVNIVMVQDHMINRCDISPYMEQLCIHDRIHGIIDGQLRCR